MGSFSVHIESLAVHHFSLFAFVFVFFTILFPRKRGKFKKKD